MGKREMTPERAAFRKQLNVINLSSKGATNLGSAVIRMVDTPYRIVYVAD